MTPLESLAITLTMIKIILKSFKFGKI